MGYNYLNNNNRDLSIPAAAFRTKNLVLRVTASGDSITRPRALLHSRHSQTFLASRDRCFPMRAGIIRLDAGNQHLMSILLHPGFSRASTVQLAGLDPEFAHLAVFRGNINSCETAEARLRKSR